MSAPRVTVLMTVYNGLPYLTAAVDSVLAQTFTDFEFLILDDGSTDGSVECLRRYAARDPRIQLVCNEQNLGQARTLNRGLELARAPLIARLDQDDVCRPDRLAREVQALETESGVDVVGSWVYYIDAQGRTTGLTGTRVESYGALLGALLTGVTPAAHTTVMYRREPVRAAGGYDVSFAPCEDYELWCRLAAQGRRLAVLPAPLMSMRLHAQQQSQQRAGQQQRQARRAHEALVASCGGTAEATGLLRMDEAWWQAASAGTIGRAVEALDHMLDHLSSVLPMSAADLAALRRRLEWWMARGALLGILQQRWASRALYRRACRGGWRMLRLPVFWLYPAGVALAPLSSPAVRRGWQRLKAGVASWRLSARRWTYTARMDS